MKDPRLVLLLVGTLTVCFGATPAFASNLLDNREIIEFIDEMERKHGFDKAALATIFAQTEVRGDIVEAISRPAEAKPWHEYRPIFVTKSRANDGLAFMRENAATLARAEQTYGVPPEIITAIIGVESRYGRYKGKYRVMDALTTLGFNYPPRAKFFRKELEQFLLLTREEGIDPLSLLGSYAGAMGQPQFISSSFRHYAVDFDGDGKRDLWDNTADVIGSVANYFKVHGWLHGQPITTQVTVQAEGRAPAGKKELKPRYTVKELKKNGVKIPGDYNNALKGALIELDGKAETEYWVGFQNFYVITRYNHSALYAMAVTQLSEKIVSASAN